MRSLRVLLGIALVQQAALGQTISPPQAVGHLAGPGAASNPSGLRLYGTDSGWTFEHRGKLVILFGDTWPDANLPCEPPPTNDDAQGTLPLFAPRGTPRVTFETKASSPLDFDPIQLFRGATSLPMGFGKIPATGFSDGRSAIAAIGTSDLVRCQGGSASTPGQCPGASLSCGPNVGECLPTIANIPLLCDATAGTGCLQGQTCTQTTGFCVDPTSSQNDGTTSSAPYTVAQNIDLGVQRPGSVIYDSAFTWPTNKFWNVNARTVRNFTFTRHGNDYRPGDNYLLMWGRPGFSGEQGRQAQLYLMAQRLPIPTDSAGHFRFRPSFFAGTRAQGHEPKWSFLESEAKPLALDGIVDGSPHEDRVLVNQTAMSYLPPPVDKWIMLYGGDVPDVLLVDPVNSRNVPSPGAIMVRFADNPWGPWTPPAPYLSPGNPAVPGDPYGPGGFLFHYACVDQGSATCARTDPHRPLDVLNPECSPPPFPFDIGRLYGANVIDAYTRPDGHGGLDFYWNVSTWNPYGVMLMKSNIRP